MQHDGCKLPWNTTEEDEEEEEEEANIMLNINVKNITDFNINVMSQTSKFIYNSVWHVATNPSLPQVLSLPAHQGELH